MRSMLGGVGKEEGRGKGKWMGREKLRWETEGG